MVTWKMANALALIRDLQPLVREFGYHLLLGGGVLNKGESKKDLDLYFAPLSGDDGDADYERLFDLLCNVFTYPEPMRNSDYGIPQVWKHMLFSKYEGKRVDIFILR